MKKEILEKVLNANKNLIIDGDIATGKTTNVLFPIVDGLIDKKENLFILDSKEEFLNCYYDKLKEEKYNIIIINMRDLNKSEGWNPLEYPYSLYINGKKDASQEYLEKIGKAIFYEGFDKNVDSFWSMTASDFFMGVVLALFEDGKPEEINLNSVCNMFNGIDKKYCATDYLTEYFKCKGDTSIPYIFASTTILAPKETKGGILSVARQKLRLCVSREKLSWFFNKTTFDFENVRNHRTAIIFIAKDENTALNAVSSMFIEQFYAILTEKHNNRKFNFILDNFDSIERCNDLIDILSSCLARNIRIFLSTRSFDGLAKKYGKYISNLCDLISIKSSEVKLVINQKEEKILKDFDYVTINYNSYIDYPKLNKKDIKLFNLEEVAHNLKMQVNTVLNNSDSNESFEFDDLINSVDEKLKEIELKEKMSDKK